MRDIGPCIVNGIKAAALMYLIGTLIGCAEAPNDEMSSGTTPPVTTGSMGGSMAPVTTTSTTTITPTGNGGTGGSSTTSEPVSPCGTEPSDDGLTCTRYVCSSTGRWENHCLCGVGETCTTNGCVPPTTTGNGGAGGSSGSAGAGGSTGSGGAGGATVFTNAPSISCDPVGNQLKVTLTGPVLTNGLVKASVANPGYLQYGSDWEVGGVPGSWSLPYAEGKWMAPWPADYMSGQGTPIATFYLPIEVNSFTFYLANTTKTEGSWFQNSKFEFPLYATAGRNACHFCDPVAKDKICH